MASSSPRIDLSSIDSIATATFASARRGYDQDEVRNALRALAGEIARGRDELARLKVELASRPHASGQVDEASVAAALGEEAAHVLTAAHSAAVQMRTRAEEASARLLREASEEAARVREAAELDAAHRRREAADAATAEVEAAKSEGRQMVMEARAVRERMLADLARRKEAARQQVDLVVDAHERVMRALGTAREHLDDAAHGLAAALPELHRPDVDDTQPVPVVAGATRSGLEMYDAALDETESDITAPSAGFHLGEMPVASSPPTVASVVGADDLRADHGDHPSTGGPAASPAARHAQNAADGALWFGGRGVCSDCFFAQPRCQFHQRQHAAGGRCAAASAHGLAYGVA